MHWSRLIYPLVAVLLLAACVTINIYFPAAQAQEAAEKIVEDILSGSDADAPVPQQQPDTGLVLPGSVNLGFASAVLQFVVPAAHAAEVRFSTDTPEVRKLQASMKSRFAALKPYYDQGAIGFTRDALVAVRDESVVSLRDRARVQKLVAAENADRNQMYKAIALANGHPEWEKDIRATFAGTWIKEASSGWWYQDARGAWVKK
jgi:uncharacterized protein YdbL (DUF1318 family)